ncbi:MAG TPA: DUF433 domain-containing protein [Polyangiaceae bacterium]|nr:DUF433 domain-containing protein [Polyangiaceae bacterium]
MIIASAFSPAEAAALLDLSERQVRKEVEHGLFTTRLNFQSLVYLQALKRLGVDLGVEDRKKLLVVVDDAVQHGTDTAPLSQVLLVKIGSLVREVRDKVERFSRWKERLITDRSILTGEPVFPKSRLAVRHIGTMLERGASQVEVKEDYPYLTDEDLEFAPLFVRAYPRVGRPRETRQAPDR